MSLEERSESSGVGRNPEDRISLYLAAAALGIGVSIGASGLGRQAGLRGERLAIASLALSALLFPYFALGMTGLGRRLQHAFARRPALLFVAAGGLLLPYLFVAGGSGGLAPGPFLRIAAYVFVPAALVFFARGANPKPGVLDALAVLALWIPLDYRLVQDAWPLPPGAGGHALHTALAVDLAVILFASFRQLDGVGWSFRVGPRAVGSVLSNFLLFALIGIPIGLGTGFLAWNPAIVSVPALAGRFASILLVTGLPEELLFRGIIQNGLAQSLGSRRAALVLASALFGVAHLNNGPSPDWRYALLAALAGIFYGRTYEATQGLLAPAAVHALVDTVWGAFLHA